MVLILGNRRVDNQEIKLDEITKEYCSHYGLELETQLLREISRKRMPKRVSHIQNFGSVQSMNKETVLIFRKRRII